MTIPDREQIAVREVTGVITTSDGVTRSFNIVASLGSWQQWGATTANLGNTVEALDAMTEALAPYLEEQ